MNIVDHLVRVALLGATWVLYLLFALSIASFAAMFERWLFFRKNGRGSDELRRKLRLAIGSGDHDGIREALEKNESVEAIVLRQALPFRRGGSEAFSDAVASALGSEKQKLDRSVTLLGTIGNNAPFVGLFGTVLGVIEAFAYLGVGDGSGMGNVMNGISEALVATAVGIFVAIPAVVGFNVAQKKAGDLENEVHTLAKLLTAFFKLEESGASLEDASVLGAPKTEASRKHVKPAHVVARAAAAGEGK